MKIITTILGALLGLTLLAAPAQAEETTIYSQKCVRVDDGSIQAVAVETRSEWEALLGHDVWDFPNSVSGCSAFTDEPVGSHTFTEADLPDFGTEDPGSCQTVVQYVPTADPVQAATIAQQAETIKTQAAQIEALKAKVRALKARVVRLRHR